MCIVITWMSSTSPLQEKKINSYKNINLVLNIYFSDKILNIFKLIKINLIYFCFWRFIFLFNDVRYFLMNHLLTHFTINNMIKVKIQIWGIIIPMTVGTQFLFSKPSWSRYVPVSVVWLPNPGTGVLLFPESKKSGVLIPYLWPMTFPPGINISTRKFTWFTQSWKNANLACCLTADIVKF